MEYGICSIYAELATTTTRPICPTTKDTTSSSEISARRAKIADAISAKGARIADSNGSGTATIPNGATKTPSGISKGPNGLLRTGITAGLKEGNFTIDFFIFYEHLFF